ncbi:MAG: hypothetical protein ABIJ09_20435 [Pseudomonadota bacterium]
MSAALLEIEPQTQRRDHTVAFLRSVRSGEASPGAHADQLGTRHVENDHVQVWSTLQDEALRAHAAFVSAARGAALARHRGEDLRAESLTRLARKQHQRWIHASRVMALYEH